MENTSKEIVSTLNDLLEINNDRSEGYQKAGTETPDTDLKALFNKYSMQSESFANELKRLVREYGGDPVNGTRTDGKLYRAWMDIKAAVSGRDRKVILSSCEFGEDVALKNYEDALKRDVILPAETREVINNQKEDLQAAHDDIKALRDAQ